MAELFSYEPILDDILCMHKKTNDNPTYFYHRHDHYEIYLFLQGNIHFYREHRCYELSPGSLLLLSPLHMHRVVSDENTVYERITINISDSMLKNLSTPKTDLSTCFLTDKDESLAPIVLSSGQLTRFIALGDQLADALSSDAFGSDVFVKILTGQLLLLIHECQSNKSATPDIMPPLVRNIMLFIREHLEEELSLERLSQTFYVSKTQISRNFKKHTGLTLRAYILDQRIEHAKHLLKTGSSISEACYASGFSDYANFMRSFKKVAGLSPKQFQKNS